MPLIPFAKVPVNEKFVPKVPVTVVNVDAVPCFITFKAVLLLPVAASQAATSASVKWKVADPVLVVLLLAWFRY